MTKATTAREEEEPLRAFYVVSVIMARSMTDARNLASIMHRAGYVDKVTNVREAT